MSTLISIILWITFRELCPGPAGHPSTVLESTYQSSRSLGVCDCSSQDPGHAAHCSRCWMTRMISRSFRGINIIKNGTFPSLSVASSII